MKTAEEIYELNGCNSKRDIIESMKLYANQKLDEAAEKVNLNCTWVNPNDRLNRKTETVDSVSFDGYRYAVNKQSILSLKDEI